MCVNDFMSIGKDELQNSKSLWRGAGTDYIAPAVAGSNPAGGVSRRSSIGRAMDNTSGPPIPATKIFQCGEGARYFDKTSARQKPGRLRLTKPACRRHQLYAAAKAQTNSRDPFVPTGTKFRDGAEPSYFVSNTTWGCRPATLLVFPPGSMLSGANRNCSVVRAGAAGVSNTGCTQNCGATDVDGAQRSWTW